MSLRELCQSQGLGTDTQKCVITPLQLQMFESWVFAQGTQTLLRRALATAEAIVIAHAIVDLLYY